MNSARPALLRYLDDAAQLRLLLRWRQRVAGAGRGKAALRAQRQAPQRHVARRLADALLDERRVLQGALLRRQQPQHDGGAGQDVLQWAEVAGWLSLFTLPD